MIPVRVAHQFVRSLPIHNFRSITISRRPLSSLCYATVVRRSSVFMTHNGVPARIALVAVLRRDYSEKSSANPSIAREADEFSSVREQRGKVAERAMKTSAYAFFGMFAIGFLAIIYMYGPEKLDEDGKPILDDCSDKFLPIAYTTRAWRTLLAWKHAVVEPSREKLLPDTLKEPLYQPPYTLVIEMNGILVHPEWTVDTGWRFKKRPALDFFLEQVGYPHFELVVFTSESAINCMPVIDGMDPECKHIMYRLFRDATKFKDGKHIKDLSKLNRDLKRVILVEFDPNAYSLQPENALRIPEWKGSNDDLELLKLAGLLKEIQKNRIDDVRPVLQNYSRHDNPLQAFVENTARLEAERTKLSQAKEAEGGGAPALTNRYTRLLFGRSRQT